MLVRAYPINVPKDQRTPDKLVVGWYFKTYDGHHFVILSKAEIWYSEDQKFSYLEETFFVEIDPATAAVGTGKMARKRTPGCDICSYDRPCACTTEDKALHDPEDDDTVEIFGSYPPLGFEGGDRVRARTGRVFDILWEAGEGQWQGWTDAGLYTLPWASFEDSEIIPEQEGEAANPASSGA